MKQSGESRRKPPYVKKCITICIQGHGSIESKDRVVEFIKSDVRKNVSVLDIPGGIARKGLMESNCPSMTMRGSKQKGISDVRLCGQALDVMSMEYFHHLYHELSKKESMPGCDIAKEGIEIITDNIPLMYANAGVPYFHNHNPDRDVTTLSQESFKLITPHYNKLYTLYPTTHEYCNPVTSNCAGGKCKLLRPRQISCPEYGITVLHSSIPSDKEYTIAGLPMVNDINIEQENRLAINLNQTEGHNPLKMRLDDDEEQPIQDPKKHSCYNFWKLKLLHHKTRELGLVQGHISHQEKKKGTEQQQTKIDKLKDNYNRIDRDWRRRLYNYNAMANIFDRTTPRSMLTDEEHDMLPYVTLEDLIDIFVNGMKYDHIYIIDPTCNSCKFDGKRPSKLLKMTAHNYTERIRTKSNRPSFLPIEYVKKYDNTTDELIEIPRPSIRVMKKANSIGGTRKRKRTRKKRNTRKGMRRFRL
jgi:hypothetical protein